MRAPDGGLGRVALDDGDVVDGEGLPGPQVAGGDDRAGPVVRRAAGDGGDRRDPDETGRDRAAHGDGARPAGSRQRREPVGQGGVERIAQGQERERAGGHGPNPRGSVVPAGPSKRRSGADCG